MNKRQVQNYSLLELALLAVFMIGLFVALLIVRDRAKVDLSQLLPLPGSGLAVSIPVGTQWSSTQSWQYEESENSMILVSEFTAPGRSSMGIRWRYCFSTPVGSEQELLEQKAEKIGAVIHSISTIGRDCPMVYAKMLLPSSSQEEVYFGMIRLNKKRSIELLIRSVGLGSSYPEDVLRSLADSIHYQPGSGLADGSVVMDQFLKIRPGQYSQRREADEAFLIKDAGQKKQGYYYAHHFVSNEGAFRTQIRQFEYNSVKFESDLWMDHPDHAYRWRSELSLFPSKATQVYTIAPSDSGGIQVSRNEKKVKEFPAGQFFLPEPLLHEFAAYFMQTEYAKVVVDVLGPTGRLVPVQLEKIAPDQANASSENADSVVRIVYLHAPNSYEELFFDSARNIVGKFEHMSNRSPRIWDAVAVEQLQQMFQEDLLRSGDPVACVINN